MTNPKKLKDDEAEAAIRRDVQEKDGYYRTRRSRSDIVTDEDGETCPCGWAAPGEPACPDSQGRPACSV